MLTIRQAESGSRIWTDRMDGPVHRIAIDKTGTKIVIACGKEVVALDQNTLCKSCANVIGTRR